MPSAGRAAQPADRSRHAGTGYDDFLSGANPWRTEQYHHRDTICGFLLGRRSLVRDWVAAADSLPSAKKDSFVLDQRTSASCRDMTMAYLRLQSTLPDGMLVTAWQGGRPINLPDQRRLGQRITPRVTLGLRLNSMSLPRGSAARCRRHRLIATAGARYDAPFARARPKTRNHSLGSNLSQRHLPASGGLGLGAGRSAGYIWRRLSSVQLAATEIF